MISNYGFSEKVTFGLTPLKKGGYEQDLKLLKM